MEIEQLLASLTAQRQIGHLDQLALGLVGFIRRRGRRYPYPWNYGAGMAVMQALGDTRLRTVLQKWTEGLSVPEAIAATMNQPWSVLGTIPGPLVKLHEPFSRDS